MQWYRWCVAHYWRSNSRQNSNVQLGYERDNPLSWHTAFLLRNFCRNFCWIFCAIKALRVVTACACVSEAGAGSTAAEDDDTACFSKTLCLDDAVRCENSDSVGVNECRAGGIAKVCSCSFSLPSTIFMLLTWISSSLFFVHDAQTLHDKQNQRK